MARFHGNVGYGEAVEDPVDSGNWVDGISEYSYRGDVIKIIRKLEDGQSLNDDISIQNRISIVADEHAREHFFKIKYVEWAGVRWTVSSVEVAHPRLILSLGSVYNGPTP